MESVTIQRSKEAMNNKGIILMQRYELGRLLGQGTFAKVYHARNLKTTQSVAIKVIDKEKVKRIGLIDQIKREISVMRLVNHPNIVQLYEVMATKSKIYFVMQYVKGGELFNKLEKGKLEEDIAWKYFNQLISAVNYCHSRGVYHRDLKPENLLLDENGNLKVSDFGLSALAESKHDDGLLHTTCGTPAYVAPEVISRRGYDGAKADIWSCGVILFVLLAGYLPFHGSNLMVMYRKIERGEFKCPHWFSYDARNLMRRILDPNPSTRVSFAKIMESPWFRKGFDYKSKRADKGPMYEQEGAESSVTPVDLNAFDIISLSAGFDLSLLFEGKERRREARFTSQQPPNAIVSKIEEITKQVSLKIEEITKQVSSIEMRKTDGDTIEYQNV